MRIPAVSRIGRYALALGAIASSFVLFGAARRGNFTVHDKAYYASPSLVAYVQPGLVFKVVSAKVAGDGTVTVDFKATDPNGAALDRTGVITPGAISSSFLIAYIPKGQSQFVSYVTRTVTSTNGNGNKAIQATSDSGGTYQTVATGEYIYTFSNKVPAGFDPAATHRIGIYGSRNLTQFDLGTNYDDVTFDWVPAGNGANPQPRDIVRTADCNRCHDSLAAHGGSRKSVELCIMCHTPQTTDPESNNTVDFKIFIHKLHAGSSLPSVQAGTPYQIVGFGNAVSDYSTVVFPANVQNCTVCHNPKNGAAQTANYMSNPNIAACNSCHDNVNFATGKNHNGGVQVDSTQCKTCHIPKGDVEFDASVVGAHVIPAQSASIPGINVVLKSVANGGAGQKPTVTFTVKDSKGNGIPMSTITGNSGSLSLVMGGPTSDYGYTDFGVSTTPGYVSESVVSTAQCAGDGTCTYTFTHALPAKAAGTYAIGAEGRMSITLLPGTDQQQTVQYSVKNPVIYFSVDGTKVQPRRTVVALANCNNCHYDLELHGGLRNNTEYCVICHNPSNTDFTTRPAAVVSADKPLPNQAINLPLMVHKIHTGENLADFNQTYVVVGHGGSHNDFSDVRYATMGPTGATGDTAKCYMCHVNGSESVLPIGKNPVVDPQGLLNPAPATTSACTACHLDSTALAHAVSNTDPKFGESCDVCHGTGAEFEATKMHAGK